MINLSFINPSTLPSVPLERRSLLPSTPCVYFAIDALNTVQYIGRSVNPKARWVSHHKHSELQEIGSIRIAYLFIDSPELLPEIETALIAYFAPPLNQEQTGRRPSSSPFKNGIRWRLRVLMAEKKISNKELAERSGVHKTTISNLRQSDAITQITSNVLGRLCNGLTEAYRSRGEDTIITPGHLLEFTPDEFKDKTSSIAG